MMVALKQLVVCTNEQDLVNQVFLFNCFFVFVFSRAESQKMKTAIVVIVL
jgi:hypothetical protein